MLAVAFPDNQTQVLPYNRVVKDLGSDTPQSLLAKLREQFTVKEGPGHAVRARARSRCFSTARGTRSTLGDGAARTCVAADRLDVSRLQDTVLTPLLGIGDVRTDKRIDFVGGARGTAELEKLVSSGKAAVAFSLYPGERRRPDADLPTPAASCRRSPRGSSQSCATACLSHVI